MSAALLVQGLITLCAAGAGAFLSEYFRTRGKNLATKADFDSLQNQLRANTELVETIKAEVGQKDWAQREWTNLRRTKLEALLEKMHDCEAYLSLLLDKAFAGKGVVQERDPFNELLTIATLYFPELEPYVYDFVSEGRTQAIRALKLRPTLNDKEEVIKQWQDNAAKLIQASHELRSAARRLLVSIMGVDEHL